MRNIEKSIPVLFVIAAFVLMALFGYLATTRPLTEMEAYVLQILSLFSGLVGSYIFGRQITQDSIKEIVEPHARSAFRRLISLYRSISRVAEIIEEDDDDRQKIAVIRAIVIEQIATADDALEDWRDLVPESVEELKKEIGQ